MRAPISAFRRHLREPWFVSVLLLCLIPLFPEYISFFLVIPAFWLAIKEVPDWRDKFLRAPRILRWLLLLIAFMAISAIYAIRPGFSLATAAMWLVLSGAAAAMMLLLQTSSRRHVFCILLALAAGITGLLATIQYILLNLLSLDLSPRFWDFLDLFLYQFFPMDLELTRGELRSASTFNNPNIFCEYLTMVIPFIIYGALQEHRRFYRAVFAVCLCLSILGVAFSFSRGGYLVLLVIFAVFIFSKPKRIPWFLAGLAVAFLLLPSSIRERFLAIGDLDLSVLGRFDAWAVCLDSFMENPLLGVGAGTANVQSVLLENGVKNLPHAHNLYMEFLTEGGLVGIGFLLLFGLSVVRRVFLLIRAKKLRSFGIAALAFGAGFALYGLVDFPLLTPKLIAQFLILIGVLLSVAEPGQTQSPPTDCTGKSV